MPKATLTAAIVRKVKAAYAELGSKKYPTKSSIADKFDMSLRQLGRIVNGEKDHLLESKSTVAKKKAVAKKKPAAKKPAPKKVEVSNEQTEATATEADTQPTTVNQNESVAVETVEPKQEVTTEPVKIMFMLHAVSGKNITITRMSLSDGETETAMVDNTNERFAELEKEIPDPVKLDGVQGVEFQKALSNLYDKVNTSKKFTADVSKLAEKMKVGIFDVDPKAGAVVCKFGNIEMKLAGALSKYIIELIQSDKFGENEKRITNFVRLLSRNPSKKILAELFGFINKNSIKIDDDGYVICYKKVKDDYMDCHTGTIRNQVGDKPFVPRSEVDASEATCSYGLHVCSKSYLSHFHGSRIMKCRVSPEDFVRIPKDYDGAKARVCGYEVIEEITGKS